MAVSALSPKAPAKPVSRSNQVCLMPCLQRNQLPTPLRLRLSRRLRPLPLRLPPLRLMPLRRTALVRKGSVLLAVAVVPAVAVAVRVKAEVVEVLVVAEAVRVKAVAVPTSRLKRITKKRTSKSLA